MIDIINLHQIVYDKLKFYELDTFVKVLDGGLILFGRGTKLGLHSLLIVISDDNTKAFELMSDPSIDNIYYFDLDQYYLDTTFINNKFEFYSYRLIKESVFNDKKHDWSLLKDKNCLYNDYEDITDKILKVHKLIYFL